MVSASRVTQGWFSANLLYQSSIVLNTTSLTKARIARIVRSRRAKITTNTQSIIWSSHYSSLQKFPLFANTHFDGPDESRSFAILFSKSAYGWILQPIKPLLNSSALSC